VTASSSSQARHTTAGRVRVAIGAGLALGLIAVAIMVSRPATMAVPAEAAREAASATGAAAAPPRESATVAAHSAATRIARMSGRAPAARSVHGEDAESDAAAARAAARIGTVDSAAARSDDDARADAGTAANAADASDWTWDIPRWLPPPPVPADNPMNAAKVELGRHLFHDHRLSGDGTIACASCHEQSLGFADGRATAVGIHGTEARRNAMGLANVAYSPVLTWGNPHMTSLERQALVPLFGEEPPEMGSGGQEQQVFARLAEDARYPALFDAAFPERDGAIDLATLTRALGAFQRTLISVGSPYDRYKYEGESGTMSDAALRGEALFFSETAECYHCHQGFNFTDTLQTSRSGFAEIAFHNTGLYDVDGLGAYPPGQTGLREFTNRAEDMGRFRTQSLRNVAVTAPYFHDGSAATLDDVLDHYAAGGRTLEGRHAGSGRESPWKNSLIKGFRLEDSMREDLKAFLHSLTDEAFLTNPAFADPWPAGHPARGISDAPIYPGPSTSENRS